MDSAANTVHEIKLLIAELFSCDYDDLSEDTGPGGIPKWDSLGHILILEALVARFDRDIPIEQAVEARTVAELARLIDATAPR